MARNEKNNDSSANPVINIIIGALLGSGGFGAGVSILNNNLTSGLIVIIGTLIATGFFYWLSEWFKLQNKKASLEELDRLYVDSFKTITSLLSRSSIEKEHKNKQEIFKIMAVDLKAQADNNKGKTTVSELFRNGTKELSDYLKSLMISNEDKELPPDQGNT